MGAARRGADRRAGSGALDTVLLLPGRPARLQSVVRIPAARRRLRADHDLPARPPHGGGEPVLVPQGGRDAGHRVRAGAARHLPEEAARRGSGTTRRRLHAEAHGRCLLPSRGVRRSRRRLPAGRHRSWAASRSAGRSSTTRPPACTRASRHRWNGQFLFGMPVPFRFGFEGDAQGSRSAWSGSLHFELFSDPSFTSDFYGRSEGFRLSETLEPVEGTTAAQTTSLTWEITNRFDLAKLVTDPRRHDVQRAVPERPVLMAQPGAWIRSRRLFLLPVEHRRTERIAHRVRRSPAAGRRRATDRSGDDRPPRGEELRARQGFP